MQRLQEDHHQHEKTSIGQLCGISTGSRIQGNMWSQMLMASIQQLFGKICDFMDTQLCQGSDMLKLMLDKTAQGIFHSNPV